jgi:hypothetical protein
VFSRWLQPVCACAAVVWLAGAAWAQSPKPTPAPVAPDTAVASGLRWHWATSAGLNSYTESMMRLQGPELGLHLRLSDVAWGGHWGFEADVLY